MTPITKKNLEKSNFIGYIVIYILSNRGVIF